MSVQPTRGWTRLVSAVFVSSIVIATAVLAFVYLGHATTVTVTVSATITTSTTTTRNGAAYLVSRSGPWVFKASTNATSIGLGGSILVSANLTYLGPGNTTIPQVRQDPPILVAVFNSTGGFVWGNGPGEVQINVNETVGFGWDLGGQVLIPTTGMPPGTYSVIVEPPLSAYPQDDVSDLGKMLQLTADFTVVETDA